jgi:asparagine synthase (glutamine-hydrolysing)
LRNLYDLYPEALPRSIRDRLKVPLNEGAGLDRSQSDSRIKTLVEDLVPDRDFRDGCRAFAAYGLESKEAYYYLSKLSEQMPVDRVPHLKGRLRLSMPDVMTRQDRLRFTA